MKQLTLIALLSVATLTASAQQATPVLQNYDVELLIFRTLNPNASPEQWSMEAAAAGQRLAIPEDEPEPFSTGAPAPTTTSRFPALAPARFKLPGIYDTLRRSRNYQPLAHFGWTQPGYARNDAKLLTINSLVPAGPGILCQSARPLWPTAGGAGGGEAGGGAAWPGGRYPPRALAWVSAARGGAGEPAQ